MSIFTLLVYLIFFWKGDLLLFLNRALVLEIGSIFLSASFLIYHTDDFYNCMCYLALT